MKVPLTLVSHALCPYVQRVAIALTEKAMPFDKVYIDLSAKPDWFVALSPFGKTPVLRVGSGAVFESAVILEFLEETGTNPLHPAEPLARAEHRGWIEFASAALNDIAGLYSAPDAAGFSARAAALAQRFARLGARVRGPFFDGDAFSLVDAAFAPVFRYFDVFDRLGDLCGLADQPEVAAWRKALAARPSVRAAVAGDYDERLAAFLAVRGSHLSVLLADAA